MAGESWSGLRPVLDYITLHYIMDQDYVTILLLLGAKDDCDFRISDLVKNPDGSDI